MTVEERIEANARLGDMVRRMPELARRHGSQVALIYDRHIGFMVYTLSNGELDECIPDASWGHDPSVILGAALGQGMT